MARRKLTASEKLSKAFDAEQQKSADSRRRAQEYMARIRAEVEAKMQKEKGVKEEVEQIDEVDYEKYLKVSQEKRPLTMRAIDAAVNTDKEWGDPNPLRKLRNTNAARKFAQARLAKKAVASQSARTFPVYEPGRIYVGDSVELDGSTIDEASSEMTHVAYLRPKKDAPPEARDHFELPVNSENAASAHKKFTRVFGSNMARHYEVVHVKPRSVKEEAEHVEEAFADENEARRQKYRDGLKYFHIINHDGDEILRTKNKNLLSRNSSGVETALSNHAFKDNSRGGTVSRENTVRALLNKAKDSNHAANLLNKSGLGHTTWEAHPNPAHVMWEAAPLDNEGANARRLQAMDKGSITGGGAEVKKHLAYLNALLAHRKKFGYDTKNVKDKIEKINRLKIAEEVEQVNESEKANNVAEKMLRIARGKKNKINIKPEMTTDGKSDASC